MQLMRDNMLASMYMQDREAAAVKDEDVQAYFDTNKGKFDRVVAQHILIASAGRGEEKALEEATKIRKQLDEKGADFGETAKKTSEDPGSKEEGGLLPGSARARWCPSSRPRLPPAGRADQPAGEERVRLPTSSSGTSGEPADLTARGAGIVEQISAMRWRTLCRSARPGGLKLDEQYFRLGGRFGAGALLPVTLGRAGERAFLACGEVPSP